MKKSREEIMEEFFRKAKEANPNVKIEYPPVKAKSTKSDALSENIKTKEQADLFKKMLNMLKQEQK